MFVNRLVIQGDERMLDGVSLAEAPRSVFGVRAERRNPGQIVLRFDSERDVPVDWIEQAAHQHPELRFALDSVEEFLEVSQRVTWKNGGRLSQHIDPRSMAWIEWESDER
jgi:hypothetical protein